MEREDNSESRWSSEKSFFKKINQLIHFWPCCMACGIHHQELGWGLGWGTEPAPPAWEVWSCNHWIAREVPPKSFLAWETWAYVYVQWMSKTLENGDNGVKSLSVKRRWTPEQFSWVAQLCATPCKTMNCSTPGFSVHHQLPELVQT